MSIRQFFFKFNVKLFLLNYIVTFFFSESSVFLISEFRETFSNTINIVPSAYEYKLPTTSNLFYQKHIF